MTDSFTVISLLRVELEIIVKYFNCINLSRKETNNQNLKSLLFIPIDYCKIQNWTLLFNNFAFKMMMSDSDLLE